MATHVKFLLCLTLCSLAAHANAAPTMISIPVSSSYNSFAAARDTASIDGVQGQAAREKAGFPMQIISSRPKREREIKNGYVTLFATWAQTSLRVPLGWSAFDSRSNIEESIVLSPGKTVRIVARAALEQPEVAKHRDAFEQLKPKVVAQTRARLQKLGLKADTIELLDAPNGDFVVRAKNVRDAKGKSFDYIEHFAQRSTSAERKIWWAKYDRKEPLSPFPMPQAMSLLAPTQSFDKHLPLLGLMLRDRGLNWSRTESLSPAEFEARSPEAKKLTQVADEAIALLRDGRVEEFLTRFPESFDGQTRAQTEKYLREKFVPFVKRLPATPTHSHIDLLSDADPQEPLFRATFVRKFTVGKTGPTYIVALERDGKKVWMLGVATSDDPEEM